MKLHLPKRLLTALLAAFTAISLSTGSAAWGASETIETSVTWTNDENDENHKYEAGDYLTVQGNGTTLTIGGETVTGDAILSLRNNGNVIINKDSNVTISRLVTHDSGSGGTSESVTLNGGVLNITNADTGSGNFWTAVLIGHWGSSPSTSLNVNGGQLNVLNGTVQLGFASAGNLNITGGEANIKKINVNSGSLSLSGGRLNIGTGGLVGSANQTATLTGGTLGVLDAEGWSLGNVATTIGTITIDTNVWNADTHSSTTTGANINLLGNITAAEDGMNITLAGSGSLTINRTLAGILTTSESAKVVLASDSDWRNFGVIYVNANGATSTSGFMNTLQVAQTGSTFANNKVYIGETAYTVTDGIADVRNMSDVFYINDTQAYDSTAMAGATSFHVREDGSLTFASFVTAAPAITNAGKVVFQQGADPVNVNTFLANVTNTASGNTTIETTGTVTMTGYSFAGTVGIKGNDAEHKANLTASSGLTGGVLELENVTATISGGGQAMKSNLTLNSGAVVTLKGDDFVNYSNDGYTWTLNEGSILNIGTATEADRQTLRRNFKLILNGGTLNGKSDGHGTLDYYNSGTGDNSIQVKKDSVLNAAVRARSGVVTFNIVGADTVLTMNSTTEGVDNYAAFTGGGSFKKDGAGTLLYQGAAFNHNLEITGGVFEYNHTDSRTYSGTLSGTGTFKKSGTGTLQLTADSLSIGTLTSSNGTLKVSGALTASNMLVEGGSVELLAGGTLSGTLNASGGITQISGTLTANDLVTGQDAVQLLSGASLDLRGKYSDLAGDGNANKLDTIINLVNKVDTQGDSYVLISGTRSTDENAAVANGGNVNQRGDLSLSSNVVVATNLNINGMGWASGGGRVFTILDDASLKIGTEGTGQLALITKAAMTIEDGSVTAGLLKLGHIEGASNNVYNGVMTVQENGSLTVQSVTFQGQSSISNNLTLNGGRLEFTKEGEVLESGRYRANNTTYQTGGKGTVVMNSGTLVAEKTSWSMTGTDNISVTLGGVDLQIAAEKTLTLGGTLNITGTMTHNSEGTLAFADRTKLVLTSEVLNNMVSEGVLSETNTGTDGLGSIKYYLVQGSGNITSGNSITLTVDGSSEGYTWADGVITGPSSIYIINSTTRSTADTDADFVGASAYHVNAEGVFTLHANIPNGKTVADILTTSTGTGKLSVTAGSIGVNSGTSVFQGDVWVETGCNLTLGNDQNANIDFSSLNSLVLNGGNVTWKAKGSHLNKLDVKTNSGWTINDMYSGSTLSIGSLSVAQESTLTVNKPGTEGQKNASWKQSLNIGVLTGSGTVSIYGPGDSSDGESTQSSLVIDSLAGFSGNLEITTREFYSTKFNRLHDSYNVSINTGADGANFGSLTFNGYGEQDETSTAIFNVQGDTTIGTLSAAGATVNITEGKTLTLIGGATDEPVSHSIGKLSAASAGVTLGNYATLTLGGGTADAHVIHNIGTINAGANSSITLSSNATLNAFSKGTGIVALKGSGILDLGNATTTYNTVVENSNRIINDAAAYKAFTVVDGWTGTIRISGAQYNGNRLGLNLNNLSNANSAVELINVNGWFTDTMQGKLILTKSTDESGNELAAWYISNGGSKATNDASYPNYVMSTFAGAVSGDGKMAFTWDRSNSATGIKFTGNVADWTGAFEMAAAGNGIFNLVFEGNANTINADITRKIGMSNHVRTHVKIDDANSTASDKTINMNGSVDAANMTLGAASDSDEVRAVINLNNDVTLSDTLTNYASTTLAKGKTISAATVSNSGTLKLGDTATITKAEGKDTASMQNVKLSEEGIASADETKATKGTVTDAKVTLAALAEGTSFSIEDVTLTNVNIEAENADDRVNLSGVSATDVQLTKGEFHMMDQAQVQVGTGGATINLPEGGVSMHTSLLEGMTLGTEGSLVVDLGDLSGFTGMDSGKPTFSITLNGFSIEGFKIGDFLADNPGIYFAADSWLGQLLVAQGASDYVKGDSLEAGAQATAGTGSGVGVSYTSTAVGTVITITGLQVPEPTTTSLSLLALSALAMRRRRK